MPATSISDYETICTLGNGGQATVTLVREKRPPNSSLPAPPMLACKQIVCSSQQVLDSAVSEIKVLLKLNHPHITRYEDFFITIEEPSPTLANPHSTRLSSYSMADWQQQRLTRQQPPPQTQQQQQFTAVVYLLTEYCECGDLAQLIRKAKNDFMEHCQHTVSEAKVLSWIESCCDALDTIHKLGFVHRDFKSSNCFLTRDGDLIIGDFGLSSRVGDANSNSIAHGTPAYVSPEQLQLMIASSTASSSSSSSGGGGGAVGASGDYNNVITPAIDVWGLGATMLELLTLQDKGINVQVLRDPAPALERVVADITNLRFSRGLALLVRDMLQRRPEDRPTPAQIQRRVQQLRSGGAEGGAAAAAVSGGGGSSAGNSNRTSPAMMMMHSNGPSPVNVVPSVPGAAAAATARSGGPPSMMMMAMAAGSRGSSPVVAMLPPGTKCKICDVFEAVIVCPACDNEPLCRSCDQMKHKSTQRQAHVRTPVLVSPSSFGQQQQQQQPQHLHYAPPAVNGNVTSESCPSSVGSSFDGGCPQPLPPAPMAAIDFDVVVPTASYSGRNSNPTFAHHYHSLQQQQQQPSTSGRAAAVAAAAGRPVTPVDPSALSAQNSGRSAAPAPAPSRPLVPLAKPKPVFSNGGAPSSARASSTASQDPQPNPPLTPTSAMMATGSGSFPFRVSTSGGVPPAPAPTSTTSGRAACSKAVAGVAAFPSKPEQPDARPLSPFSTAATTSPSSLVGVAVGADAGVPHRYSPPTMMTVAAGPPRPTIEVPSPQFPTIAAALLRAESGSRIVVNGSGVFSDALDFTRPDVEIVGAPAAGGKRPTIEVRGTKVGAAVRIADVARIKLCNLCIVHAGPPCATVTPPSGSLGGGGGGQPPEPKQFAILIADAAGAVIENCDVTSESGSGIGVAGAQCDPLISGCTVTAHLNGVHVSGGACGTVRHCCIRGTTLAAILVKRKAAPRIVSNTLENNGQAGIFFFRAGGLTERNTIVHCGGCAIVIKGNSNPIVRRNRIQHCAQAGILISDESRGTISENVIQHTRKTGLLIKTRACPVVVRNHISRGQEAGIYVFENGGGRIEENEVVDNANAGIIVTTGGNPTVVNNRVLRNTFEGIWVCNEGSGRFEKNILEGNGRRGAVDIQPGCKVEWIA